MSCIRGLFSRKRQSQSSETILVNEGTGGHSSRRETTAVAGQQVDTDSNCSDGNVTPSRSSRRTTASAPAAIRKVKVKARAGSLPTETPRCSSARGGVREQTRRTRSSSVSGGGGGGGGVAEIAVSSCTTSGGPAVKPAPGQASVTAGKTSAAPGQSVATTGHSFVTPGKKKSVTPGQSPVTSSVTPPQTCETPGQSFLTPVRSSVTPVEPLVTFGQSSTTPGQIHVTPTQSSVAADVTSGPSSVTSGEISVSSVVTPVRSSVTPSRQSFATCDQSVVSPEKNRLQDLPTASVSSSDRDKRSAGRCLTTAPSTSAAKNSSSSHLQPVSVPEDGAATSQQNTPLNHDNSVFSAVGFERSHPYSGRLVSGQESITVNPSSSKSSSVGQDHASVTTREFPTSLPSGQSRRAAVSGLSSSSSSERSYPTTSAVPVPEGRSCSSPASSTRAGTAPSHPHGHTYVTRTGSGSVLVKNRCESGLVNIRSVTNSNRKTLDFPNHAAKSLTKSASDSTVSAGSSGTTTSDKDLCVPVIVITSKSDTFCLASWSCGSSSVQDPGRSVVVAAACSVREQSIGDVFKPALEDEPVRGSSEIPHASSAEDEDGHTAVSVQQCPSRLKSPFTELTERCNLTSYPLAETCETWRGNAVYREQTAENFTTAEIPPSPPSPIASDGLQICSASETSNRRFLSSYAALSGSQLPDRREEIDLQQLLEDFRWEDRELALDLPQPTQDPLHQQQENVEGCYQECDPYLLAVCFCQQEPDTASSQPRSQHSCHSKGSKLRSSLPELFSGTSSSCSSNSEKKKPDHFQQEEEEGLVPSPPDEEHVDQQGTCDDLPEYHTLKSMSCISTTDGSVPENVSASATADRSSSGMSSQTSAPGSGLNSETVVRPDSPTPAMDLPGCEEIAAEDDQSFTPHVHLTVAEVAGPSSSASSAAGVAAALANPSSGNPPGTSTATTTTISTLRSPGSENPPRSFTPLSPSTGTNSPIPSSPLASQDGGSSISSPDPHLSTSVNRSQPLPAVWTRELAALHSANQQQQAAGDSDTSSHESLAANRGRGGGGGERLTPLGCSQSRGNGASTRQGSGTTDNSYLSSASRDSSAHSSVSGQDEDKTSGGPPPRGALAGVADDHLGGSVRPNTDVRSSPDIRPSRSDLDTPDTAVRSSPEVQSNSGADARTSPDVRSNPDVRTSPDSSHLSAGRCAPAQHPITDITRLVCPGYRTAIVNNDGVTQGDVTASKPHKPSGSRVPQHPSGKSSSVDKASKVSSSSASSRGESEGSTDPRLGRNILKKTNDPLKQSSSSSSSERHKPSDSVLSSQKAVASGNKRPSPLGIESKKAAQKDDPKTQTVTPLELRSQPQNANQIQHPHQHLQICPAAVSESGEKKNKNPVTSTQRETTALAVPRREIERDSGTEQEEEEEEEEEVEFVAGLMDVYQLERVERQNKEGIRSVAKKYRKEQRKTEILQHYVVHQTKELRELSRLLRQVESQGTALKDEARNLDVELQKTCDLMGFTDEDATRKHEPLMYKKYCAVKTAADAKTLLATIRNRQKALHVLEAMTYRKLVALQHSLKIETETLLQKEDKPRKTSSKFKSPGSPTGPQVPKKPRKVKDLAALCSSAASNNTTTITTTTTTAAAAAATTAGAAAMAAAGTVSPTTTTTTATTAIAGVPLIPFSIPFSHSSGSSASTGTVALPSLQQQPQLPMPPLPMNLSRNVAVFSWPSDGNLTFEEVTETEV